MSTKTKTIIVFRHGQGQHQTEERNNVDRDLGPLLTQRGMEQAIGIQDDTMFCEAFAASRRCMFVASNLVRAIDTMRLAKMKVAPDEPIIVQPLARERAHEENDLPSKPGALAEWASQHGNEFGLHEYEHTLADYGGYDGYVDDIRKNELKAGCCSAVERMTSRAQALIQWLGSQDEADTIFLASHGAFLNWGFEPEADASWCARMEHNFLRQKHWHNCQVRKFLLVQRGGSWQLQRPQKRPVSCFCAELVGYPAWLTRN